MRNPVARNDYNRAATHPDRSKEPKLTVDEGLLDYYAENAHSVAQEVYEDACSRVAGTSENYHVVQSSPPVIVVVPELSEQDIKDRVLRVEMLSVTPVYYAAEDLTQR